MQFDLLLDAHITEFLAPFYCGFFLVHLIFLANFENRCRYTFNCKCEDANNEENNQKTEGIAYG